MPFIPIEPDAKKPRFIPIGPPVAPAPVAPRTGLGRFVPVDASVEPRTPAPMPKEFAPWSPTNEQTAQARQQAPIVALPAPEDKKPIMAPLRAEPILPAAVAPAPEDVRKTTAERLAPVKSGSFVPVPDKPARDIPLPILRAGSAAAAMVQSAGRAVLGIEKRALQKADTFALSRGWMEPKSDTPELRNASPYERWSTWKKGLIENADQFMASDLFEEPRRRFTEQLKQRAQPTGAITDYWNHGLRSADLDMRTADAGNRFATGNIDPKQMREILRSLKAEDS